MNHSSWTRFSILVTGIGGQGVLLISKVIAVAATDNRFFACRTESRGLSQRGGSVCSEVRFGWKELAPVIGTGEDLIIALDGLEALRVRSMLRPEGTLLANSAVTMPAHLTRQPEFDDAQKSALEQRVFHELNTSSHAAIANFQALVDHAGCPACLNSALIGAASAFIPLPKSSLRNALAALVKPAKVEENLLAFDIGINALNMQHAAVDLLAISA